MKDRIKKLREVLNLKQRELAERLDSSVSTIGMWETGERPVPKTRVYQICKEFHVRREWLENGEGEMFVPEEAPKSPDDILREAALTLFRELSPRAQDALIAAMEEVSNDRINAAIREQLKKPVPPTPKEEELERKPPVEVLVAMRDIPGRMEG